MIKPINDWRVIMDRPVKAHLWWPLMGGFWKSKCGKAKTLDISVTTHPAHFENGLTSKCKNCINYEVRRKRRK